MMELPNRTASRAFQLIKGTMVYGVGNVLSKTALFFILPIITGKVSPADYGFYDLVITMTSIVVPLITLQTAEGLYKYTFNAGAAERRAFISSTMVVIVVSAGLFASGVAALNAFTSILKYPVYIVLYFVGNEFLLFLQKLARSLGRNKIFTLSGLINTLATLGLQLLLLFQMKSGIKGLLGAAVIGTAITIAFLAVALKVAKYLRPDAVAIPKIKTILKFSAPLVPNAVSWWGFSMINSLLVVACLGTEHNGIYGISRRMATLLTFFTNIFQMAWQDNAMINSAPENSRENSMVFRKFARTILSFAALLLPLIHLAYPLLIHGNYGSSSQYVPFLIMAAVFNAFAEFCGAGYIVSGKTGGAFTTNVWGMTFNLLVTLLGIKRIGLYAPALGTLSANVLVFGLRIVQMKDYFRIDIRFMEFTGLIILAVFAALPYFRADLFPAYFVLTVVSVAFIIINKRTACSFLRMIPPRSKDSKT
jgi:O-antigen/teichoic acid export membrane protein